ncbi:hypothetical protein [Celeribacter neptunius]|uniref:Uncharacterized protein n=1 Tax=Celeribacter neptunius TaxID=588602 RepID=A0A1I3Y7J7_9RHOB|nr:hypothetical protein [Celeribacter neptunius]SFK27957.1 hypothetical protein SAMN04487991_4280 [Celeribacter neptunius]
MSYLQRLLLSAALLAASAGVAGPLAANDFADPTWPCVQRKVDRLSPGLMWPEPLTEAEFSTERQQAVTDLAEFLALRRVDLEAARAAVAEFSASHGHDMALMQAVFSRVFDTLATRRTKIIKGIGKFSLSQISLSERIETARGEMDAQMAQETPDFDRVDALEEQLDWDQRIFTDRQKTITYLCETPTLLEKRLYALAQMLHEAGQGGG